MAKVINAMSEAIKSLDYAVTALMASEGAFMRDTLAEMIEARQTVADMLAALVNCLDLIEGEGLDELHGDLAEVVRDAIAKAKGKA